MVNPVKVIVIEPGKNPVEKVIENDLTGFQSEVGGYIEVVPFPFMDALMICDEEGKFKDYRYNFTLYHDDIVGTVVVCGQDGEEFADVPFTVEELKERMPALWFGTDA